MCLFHAFYTTKQTPPSTPPTILNPHRFIEGKYVDFFFFYLVFLAVSTIMMIFLAISAIFCQQEINIEERSLLSANPVLCLEFMFGIYCLCTAIQTLSKALRRSTLL